MPFLSSSERALRVFCAAHQFLREHDIRWLPVNSEDIIIKHSNWKLKYVSQLAYEIDKDEQYILDHVMRSQDGLSMYDVRKDSYNIIINAADDKPPGRVLWSKMHEIGHIYLGHLRDNHLTAIVKEELPQEMYDRMEFEADMFAGECPYCGGRYGSGANFCPFCGTALKPLLTKADGEPCGNRQNADAAFCEQCGKPVIRIRQGFCFEECEI